MTNRGSGHHIEYMPMVCPALVKSTSPRLRVSWQLVRSGKGGGLHITYGVVWYNTGQGSPPGTERKLRIDNHDEGNGKPPRFIPPGMAWIVLLYRKITA